MGQVPTIGMMQASVKFATKTRISNGLCKESLFTLIKKHFQSGLANLMEHQKIHTIFQNLI